MSIIIEHKVHIRDLTNHLSLAMELTGIEVFATGPSRTIVDETRLLSFALEKGLECDSGQFLGYAVVRDLGYPHPFNGERETRFQESLGFHPSYEIFLNMLPNAGNVRNINAFVACKLLDVFPEVGKVGIFYGQRGKLHELIPQARHNGYIGL